MKFGPAEMAQMMDGAKALLTVTMVYSVGIGIVLGAVVALYRIFFRHHAADQSLRSGMPTGPALPTGPAQEIDATAPHSPRSPVPRANNLLRLVDLLGIIILIAIAGGGFFSYYTSKRSDFEATSNQLVIQPLPPTIEPQQQVREATPNQLVIQPLPPTIEPRSSRCAQIVRRLACPPSFNATYCDIGPYIPLKYRSSITDLLRSSNLRGKPVIPEALDNASLTRPISLQRDHEPPVVHMAGGTTPGDTCFSQSRALRLRGRPGHLLFAGPSTPQHVQLGLARIRQPGRRLAAARTVR